jgi:Lethal giant larvae(Lgl) like, C-terminal
MRGPRIILRHPCTKRKSGGVDSFTALTWSICGLNGELAGYCNHPDVPYMASVESTSPSLRLFAATASGTIQVLTLVHAQSGWSVDPNILTLSPIENLTNLTTLIVVDAKTGEELTASPERLLAAVEGAEANGVYWIVATATEVRCMDGVRMKKIGRAGFPVGGVGAKEIGVVRHAGALLSLTVVDGE